MESQVLKSKVLLLTMVFIYEMIEWSRKGLPTRGFKLIDKIDLFPGSTANRTSPIQPPMTFVLLHFNEQDVAPLHIPTIFTSAKGLTSM